ncbi:hypothetical protein [Crossiella cryophila]|uniref:Uncharacterized protein n=1 Tax=Crossiella cryophila TaxID=43355 RepID=A0A7W7CF06_9PSEU|nr:hypothetical protein [Crossiella cryophila]MBB4679949.1 hypothetical protein [Crossiella cryophila]
MDSSPAEGHPPVAVFRDPTTPAAPPRFATGVHDHAQLAASALAEVATHAPEPLRGNGIRRAMAATADLVAAVSGRVVHLPGETLPTHSPSESYFRVRETVLPAEQAALHGVLVVLRGLADLATAPVSGADLALELAGMRQALLDLLATPAPAAATAQEHLPAPEPVRSADPHGEWRARWIIGHQVHVLFNVGAAAAVFEAARQLRRDDPAAAVAAMRRAVIQVRGFPAAMAHACAMPAEHYQRVLRPTMAPPAEPKPLSGRMHRGYKFFRTAIRELLTELPEPYNELHARTPGLAIARDDLLEADLIDAERHATLAYSMVFLRHSIAQHQDGPANAVAELRQIRHRRAAAYAPLTRFGDRYTAAAVAALRD